MKVISFRDNVAGKHGDVLRSSAIFYYRNSKNIKSTVSILNYWKFKRDIDVSVLASVRNMSGKLLYREPLSFQEGYVINFTPFRNEDFEGSVEIEVFSLKNMVIPYSAIVACYETKFGFSAVHGYARAYSVHEFEEGRTLTEGKEGCWTIRDSKTVRSFAVIHNGFNSVPAQKVSLAVINKSGEKKSVTFDWPELKPFETRKIFASEHFDNLNDFLQNEVGQAQVDFKLGAGFTRMLVANETINQDDLQVTHSNFDYTRLPTDLTENNMDGYMHVPEANQLVSRVIVYPQMVAGKYQVTNASGKTTEFQDGQALLLKKQNQSDILTFRRLDGSFPTRLVTALELNADQQRIPGECSLGVITKLQPLKRFWWGLCSPTNLAQCSIIVHDLVEVFSGLEKNCPLEFALYSSKTKDVLKSQIFVDDLNQFGRGVAISDVWPDAEKHLDGGFGYYTMFCNYGGLTTYTLMKNAHGSVCLEHGF